MGLLDSRESEGSRPWAPRAPHHNIDHPPSSSGHWISTGPIVMLLLWPRPYGQHGICGPAQAKSSTFVAILGTKVPGFVWDPLGDGLFGFLPRSRLFHVIAPSTLVGSSELWRGNASWVGYLGDHHTRLPHVHGHAEHGLSLKWLAPTGNHSAPCVPGTLGRTTGLVRGKSLA